MRSPWHLPHHVVATLHTHPLLRIHLSSFPLGSLDRLQCGLLSQVCDLRIDFNSKLISRAFPASTFTFLSDCPLVVGRKSVTVTSPGGILSIRQRPSTLLTAWVWQLSTNTSICMKRCISYHIVVFNDGGDLRRVVRGCCARGVQLRVQGSEIGSVRCHLKNAAGLTPSDWVRTLAISRRFASV